MVSDAAGSQQCSHTLKASVCLDSGPWSPDLAGHRGRPPLRSLLQTSSPSAAAGGDNAQAGLGSHVSDALSEHVVSRSVNVILSPSPLINRH